MPELTVSGSEGRTASLQRPWRRDRRDCHHWW